MVEIEAFAGHHLVDAATLFAEDVSALRREHQSVPERYERIGEIAALLEEMVASHPSVVATLDGTLIGYMTGYSGIEACKGSFCGAYIPEWAHSARDLGFPKARVYEALYRAIAREWVDQNVVTHLVSLLTSNDMRRTFSWLGFGMLVIDAVRELEPTTPPPDTGDFDLRLAGEGDIPQLRVLDRKLSAHLADTPIFLHRDPQQLPDDVVRKEFLSGDVITVVALRDEKIVSCIRGEKGAGNFQLIRNPGNVAVNFGYTLEAYRNAGIASLLLKELFRVAQQMGFRSCSVDFESQNIEGKYFWLKHFSPICYSMMRKIDDRYVK